MPVKSNEKSIMIEQIWIMDKYDKQFAVLKIIININDLNTFY